MRKDLTVIAIVMTFFAFYSPVTPPVNTDVFVEYAFVAPDVGLEQVNEISFTGNLSFTNYERDVSVVHSPQFDYADHFIGRQNITLNENVCEGTLQYILRWPASESPGKYGVNHSPPRLNSGNTQKDIVMLC